MDPLHRGLGHSYGFAPFKSNETTGCPGFAGRRVATEVGGIVLAQLVFDLCMSCQLCCGGTGLIRTYFAMMKTPPWNYLHLADQWASGRVGGWVFVL